MVGAVDNRVRHHRSIAEVESLRFRRQLVGYGAPLGVVALLVREQVASANAAVRSDLAEGDLALLEQPHQEGP